jgi:transcriptional regulator with XRE-family HTH domain
MARTASHAQANPDPAAVATKAVLRAASLLALSQQELAGILGVSPASVSRMALGQRTLQLGTKEGDFAILLVRVFRSLDALVGGDADKAQAWMANDNLHLGGKPQTLLQRIDGIVHVAEYLDAMRAKV